MQSSGLRASLVLFLTFTIISGQTVSAAPFETQHVEAAPANDARVQQAITRLTFGARPGDVDRISKMGVDAFIRQQLDPDTIDDSAVFKRLEKLPTLSLSTPTLAEQYNPPKPTPTPTPTASTVAAAATDMKMDTTMAAAEPSPTPAPAASPTPSPKPTPVPKNPGMVVTELQRAKLLRAVYSERQLYEVVVDFWENHFSIYANKDADRWMMTEFDRDAVRPFALGRFRDLLGATAKSPAMLFYLDNWQSSLLREYPATKDKPARRSGGINENYARELMELHTLGVDGGYSQKDVQEVARCFTGWTIRKPNEEGTFVYNPAAHDNGEKVVLGVKIPAGGGIVDGERVLDILAKNPATARFVVTKMARRFLGDNPPPAAIARSVAVFLKTDGSILETLKSIVTSKEFFSPATFQNKVKNPFEYVASALRATGAETDAGRPVLDWIGRMGQPVYGRLTPDGYPDMTADWLSNNDLLARLNFASALAMNTLKGTKVDIAKLVASDDKSDLPTAVVNALLMRRASERTLGELKKLAAEPTVIPAAMPATATQWTAANPKPPASPPIAAELVALALGSPEFQHK